MVVSFHREINQTNEHRKHAKTQKIDICNCSHRHYSSGDSLLIALVRFTLRGLCSDSGSDTRFIAEMEEGDENRLVKVHLSLTVEKMAKIGLDT